MANKEVNLIMRLREDVSKGLANINKKVSQVSNKMQGMSKKQSMSWVDLCAKVYLYTQGIRTAARAMSIFINAASKVEGLQVRLKVLFGSVEKGNKVFEEMADLAGKVPKTYDEIMEGATTLAGVVRGGTEEIKKLMPIIIDLSAATGMSVMDTTSQMVRMYSAGAASADMFRERGVLAMLGFESGVSVSAENTMKRVFAAYEDAGSKFRGASKELAKTWIGQMSMLSDSWFKFTAQVGNFITKHKGLADVIGNVIVAFNFYAAALERVAGVQEKISNNAQIAHMQEELRIVNLMIEKWGEVEEKNQNRIVTNQQLVDLLTQRARLQETINRLELVDSAELIQAKPDSLGKVGGVGLRESLDDAVKEYADFQATIAGATTELVGTMEDGFTTFFQDAFKGDLKSAEEYFKSFGQAVMDVVAQMIAKFIMLKMIKSALGMFGGGAVDTVASLGGGDTFGNMSFASGTPFVPNTGMALVHQGEAIVPRNENRAGGGGGGVVINITPVIQAWDAQDVMRNKNVIKTVITQSIRDNSEVRKIIKAYA